MSSPKTNSSRRWIRPSARSSWTICPSYSPTTVGFIRKFADGAGESFKSTLDEVREADLLVHVVDISHPSFEEQIDVVNKTLAEIDKTEKPMIMVFNKVDAFTFVPKTKTT